MSDLIPVGSRIALKDGMDKVYVYALPQAEGWVRDHKVDNDGFPLVYVEWDKDHWRYNGQKDGWTFQEHFDVKERAENTTEPKPSLEDFLAQMKGDDPPQITDEQAEEFFDELSEAFEHASEGEGYFVIAVRRKKIDGADVLYPEIFAGSLSEEAGLLMDAQIAQIAAASYQEMMMKMVNTVLQQRKEGL
jgi:hypothetical protein